MTLLEAAEELIREIDINRELQVARRDTDIDHQALIEARRRFDGFLRRGESS